MHKSENDLTKKQKEFVEFLENSSNKDLPLKDEEVIEEIDKSIHLNSLITKNISLFTKNPNYKLLAWLIVQLTILSLFILTASFLKNNLVPYINSL